MTYTTPIAFPRALTLMRTGSRLMMMNSQRKPEWFVVPGGRVEQKTADALLQRSDVVSNQDGLFPGVSQTWRMSTFS